MSGLEGLLTGQVLVKRYRIQEVIGRGGFAAVYRADDERLGRQVAVKVITMAAPDGEAAERHRERFEREARAAASLPQHPNVVTVYDFGVDPTLGLDFLVMEYLPGEDLATRLRREGRLPLALSRRILRDAAAGLAVGHRAGIVHGDVKPGNIYLARGASENDLRVCILDFGIARVVADDRTLTRYPAEGHPLSPAYASPEQIRGASDLTPASDVFSLGVVAYQLLTGEKPFPPDRSSDAAAWVPVRGLGEVNPDVPAPLEMVVQRALSYSAGDRYPDADAFAAALADTVSVEEALVPPTAAAAVAAPAAEPALDRTLYQPEPAAQPISERQQLVFRESAAPPRKSRAGPVAFLLLLVGGAAAGFWYLSGDVTVPVDSTAEADIELIANDETDDPDDADPSASSDPDEPASPADIAAPVVVLPPPVDSTRLAPLPGAPGLGTPAADTIPRPANDSAAAAASDSMRAEVPEEPAPVVDQRPPPRVLGVPVDSIRPGPPTPADDAPEAAEEVPR